MAIKKQKYDPSNVRKVILNFPAQFRIGLESAKKIRTAGRFDSLIICGMGGSALPGDILKIWLEDCKTNIPLCVHRDYGLPRQTKARPLIICISYSGNTEETLSAFKEARKRNLNVAAIASGGKLAKLCQRYKIPLAKIPAGFQPRMALGFQFAALMKVLTNYGIIKNELKNILALEKNLKPEKTENQGKKLAKKIIGKIPLIYISRRLAALARIWKIKFNENSKIPAFYNYFPELNHNEMVGFTKTKNKFYIIILRDSADRLKIKKRMKLLAEILKAKKIPVEFIDMRGKNILHKTFNNIIISDWASYYLALEYKTDPEPVKIIEEFKLKFSKKV